MATEECDQVATQEADEVATDGRMRPGGDGRIRPSLFFLSRSVRPVVYYSAAVTLLLTITFLTQLLFNSFIN